MKKQLSLTRRQFEIFEYIKLFRKQNGYFPTMKEVAKDNNLSIPTIQGYIMQLELKGAIEKVKHKSRAYKILAP